MYGLLDSLAIFANDSYFYWPTFSLVNASGGTYMYVFFIL